MTPIVFLDTETTGVHQDRQPWEIAMIRRDDTGEREWQCFLEVSLEAADPYGLEVGRFYERHPHGRWLSGRGPQMPVNGINYREREDAAALVARVTHGAHIVGLVPNFDTETLAPLLRWYDQTPAWHYHLIDVETMAIGWLYQRAADPADLVRLAPPTSSDSLSRACEVERPTDEERHTALGDARWAMRWYDRIVGDNQ